MVQINIEDFETYDLEMIHEFLLLQDETHFEIVLCEEKDPARFNNDILHGEFHIASYVGHLISQMSENFSYKVPSEKGELSFSFRGINFDIKKLAALINVLVGFYYTEMEESSLQFLDEADDYWDKAWTNQIVTPTWGLLRVAYKYAE